MDIDKKQVEIEEKQTKKGKLSWRSAQDRGRKMGQEREYPGEICR